MESDAVRRVSRLYTYLGEAPDCALRLASQVEEIGGDLSNVDLSRFDDSTELLLECEWGLESPLWVRGYQVDIESVQFSEDLVRAMLNWADTFVMNKKEQGGFEWVDGFDVKKYDDLGQWIQEKLAEELGTGFRITRFDSGDFQNTVRGARPSSSVPAGRSLSTWIVKNAIAE